MFDDSIVKLIHRFSHLTAHHPFPNISAVSTETITFISASAMATTCSPMMPATITLQAVAELCST